MEIEFSAKGLGQCIFCLKISRECQSFRLVENEGLPPFYRTLYTYKCAVCPLCRNRGLDHIKHEIVKCMDEYMGGKL